MAIIPLRQTVTVTRSTGELDDWGRPLPGESTEYRCRAREASEVVTDVNGKEVVASTSFLLDGLVDVGYSDIIKYTNEIGHTIEKRPISIRVTRDFGGKPIFTEVSI